MMSETFVRFEDEQHKSEVIAKLKSGITHYNKIEDVDIICLARMQYGYGVCNPINGCNSLIPHWHKINIDQHNPIVHWLEAFSPKEYLTQDQYILTYFDDLLKE